jgi:hypothetical protein
MQPLLLCFALLLVSCDKGAPAPKPTPRKPSADLITLVSLRATQRTVITITQNGRIYICQPDADSSVRVFENGELRYTALTPARIAQQMGETQTTGSIRSIVTLPSGEILAYYSGTSRRSSLTSLVTYDPNTEAMKVVATSSQLAEVTKMGLSIDLADAQLVRAGNSIWLWLQHVDQSVLFALEPRQILSGDTASWRPIRNLRMDEGTLTLTAGDQLFGQLDGTVWTLRPSTGELWRLSVEGRAFGGLQSDKRPRLSVVPLVLREGKTKEPRLLFYPFEDIPADPLTAPDLSDADATRYPAFVASTKDKQLVLDRDAMKVRPAFPLYAIRITTWQLDPAGDGIVAYDIMSGEILRLRFYGL